MTVPDFVSLWNGARPALGSRLWGLGCWLLWQIQRRRPPSLAGAECWSSECWSSGYRRMTGSYTWVSCQALDLTVSLISPELCTGQGIGHQIEATGLRGARCTFRAEAAAGIWTPSLPQSHTGVSAPH